MVKISFGLVNERCELTNAGALLADESPIRCSRLFCTRWNGLNKSGGAVDALDDVEYSGSVISLIENGEAFIKRNCKMKWRKIANSREEMPEYVERSYHEALVNALAHRDYLVNGKVKKLFNWESLPKVTRDSYIRISMHCIWEGEFYQILGHCY